MDFLSFHPKQIERLRDFEDDVQMALVKARNLPCDRLWLICLALIINFIPFAVILSTHKNTFACVLTIT